MSQPWDVPLFGPPVPEAGPVRWALTERDKEDALKARWVRYRGPMIPCRGLTGDPKLTCRPVAWLLVIGKKETPLCYLHKQEYLDRQTLDAPRG